MRPEERPQAERRRRASPTATADRPAQRHRPARTHPKATPGRRLTGRPRRQRRPKPSSARGAQAQGQGNRMTPEGSRHTTGMNLVAYCLRRVFHSGFHVRIRNPLAADDYSEPEPDVAVVTGTIRDYRDAHPTMAVLIVEVSDDSPHHDPTVKQRLYAPCGISRVLGPRPPRYPSRGLPRSGSRRLPQRHQACSRRQRCTARPPRRADRRRRSASLTRAGPEARTRRSSSSTPCAVAQ